MWEALDSRELRRDSACGRRRPEPGDVPLRSGRQLRGGRLRDAGQVRAYTGREAGQKLRAGGRALRQQQQQQRGAGAHAQQPAALPGVLNRPGAWQCMQSMGFLTYPWQELR